mmetsp:Transcript_22830/g.34590  ORF Transcript_22830/g.34590 Transcript_22830/m.34590 type:complete len:153 (+) Transcript_22830:171-629(+)
MISIPTRCILLAVFMLVSCASAFTVPTSTTTTAQRTVVTTTDMQLYSSTDKSSNDQQNDDIMDYTLLPLKFVGVLAVKTVKDAVNYPPQVFEALVKETSNKNETNPLVMFFKLMGIFVFKVFHDATHYPIVWTQRWAECQSLEECPVDPDEY